MANDTDAVPTDDNMSKDTNAGEQISVVPTVEGDGKQLGNDTNGNESDSEAMANTEQSAVILYKNVTVDNNDKSDMDLQEQLSKMYVEDDNDFGKPTKGPPIITTVGPMTLNKINPTSNHYPRPYLYLHRTKPWWNPGTGRTRRPWNC